MCGIGLIATGFPVICAGCNVACSGGATYEQGPEPRQTCSNPICLWVDRSEDCKDSGQKEANDGGGITVADLGEALSRRGPDSLGFLSVHLDPAKAQLAASELGSGEPKPTSPAGTARDRSKPGGTLELVAATLQLRGEAEVAQPLKDAEGNVLLFNGEIFGGLPVGPAENDGEVLLTALGRQRGRNPPPTAGPMETERLDEDCTGGQPANDSVPGVLSRLRGPWALAYWEAGAQTLWYGRDAIGRRSLLVHRPTKEDPRFVLSSVCPIGSLASDAEAGQKGPLNGTGGALEGQSGPPQAGQPIRGAGTQPREWDDDFIGGAFQYWQEVPGGLYSCTLEAGPWANGSGVGGEGGNHAGLGRGGRRGGPHGGHAGVWVHRVHQWEDPMLLKLSSWERQATALDPQVYGRSLGTAGPSQGSPPSAASESAPSSLASGAGSLASSGESASCKDGLPRGGEAAGASTSWEQCGSRPGSGPGQRQGSSGPEGKAEGVEERQLAGVPGGSVRLEDHVESVLAALSKAVQVRVQHIQDPRRQVAAPGCGCQCPAASEDTPALGAPASRSCAGGAAAAEKDAPAGSAGGCQVSAAQNRVGCARATSVGVLFSGGLDSMILAALADRHLAPCSPIELLNVSFVGSAAPDRQTAIAGVAELRHLSPSRRWRLVEVDASLADVDSQRARLLSLICPSNTHMDLNIGAALWLAAGGEGRTTEAQGDATRQSSWEAGARDHADGAASPGADISNDVNDEVIKEISGGDAAARARPLQDEGAGADLRGEPGSGGGSFRPREDTCPSESARTSPDATGGRGMRPAQDGSNSSWDPARCGAVGQDSCRNRDDEGPAAEGRRGEGAAARELSSSGGGGTWGRARVLLVGTGADEQCGGYARYRTKFRLGGWRALEEEMRLDVRRLWHRNLGRDDRCIADRGKEARFPFLDESVMGRLLEAPLEAVVDLRLPAGVGDKRILREVAHRLGISGAALLPKRAIQFGSRIARESNQRNFGSNRAANQASAGGLTLGSLGNKRGKGV